MSASADDLLAMRDQELLGASDAVLVTRMSVGGVLCRRVNGDLAVLVLKRVAGDEYGGLEELPSGGVEPGETAGEALRREKREKHSGRKMIG